jgi:two-component system sensor histidine kinase MprB
VSPARSSRSWWSRRSLTARLALISAVAVVAAIAMASAVAYVATAQALRSQVDAALTSGPRATGTPSPGTRPTPGVPGAGQLVLASDPEVLCGSAVDVASHFQATVGSIQLVRADGSTCAPAGTDQLVPQAEDVAVANGAAATRPRDAVTVAGTHVRVRTSPIGTGYALLTARDLSETDATLHQLGLVLILATGAGALLASAVGLVVARAGLRPIDDLTRAAERIAATQDLTVPIEVRGDDEVARLARAFNAMTSALVRAGERQQQMVADASHELRTPLTSLRTNIELLVRSEQSDRALPPADRQALLEGVTAQLAELGDLVSELTVLSHPDPAPTAVPVRLDDVVRRAVERATRRGDHVLDLQLEPWELDGDPAAMERAVLNVLDNAIKFSPPSSVVRIRLDRGVLTVSDSGPGIPVEEQELVFDRFWRSPHARAMPGSGLGLAIVADVVSAHGGSVWAATAPTGGAVIGLRIPGRAPATSTV